MEPIIDAKPGCISVTWPSDRPELSADGGVYSYSTIYTLTSEGWSVTYQTSAKLPYCKVHGRFDSCDGCSMAEYCQPEVLTVSAMARAVAAEIGWPRTLEVLAIAG
jgi:hypothetical protein